MFNINEPHKVALVLSSGGARGLAHIGVINELIKNGCEITSIAGSSVGALIGGIYASGHLDDFTEWASDLDQIDVFELLDFTFTGQGFIKGEKLINQLRNFITEELIEDLPIPFTAVATDIITRKEIVFNSGNLINAIRASVAIPTVITPVLSENMVLVDGGVVNPIPADVIYRHPTDLLVVCDVNFNKPFVKPDIPSRPLKEHEYSIKRKIFELIRSKTSFFSSTNKPGTSPGYLDVIDKTLDIMQDRICQLTKKNYKPDLTIEISRDSAGTFEFYRTNELIEVGRQAFYEALSKKTNLF